LVFCRRSDFVAIDKNRRWIYLTVYIILEPAAVAKTMNLPRLARNPSCSGWRGGDGFTLIELLTVIAIVSILASILLPALSKAQARARGIACLNNTKQLELACSIYAGDNGDRLPYNLGMVGSPFRTDLNWVNNVMTWDLSSDNTNPATLTKASLGAYVGGNTGIYHCPSDQALSSAQRAAGWTARLRSYSMNAMVGDAGGFITNGVNVNNPDYIQFFKTTQIRRPSDIFVFLDEHPDSIDDGYFLNKDTPSSKSGYGGNNAATDQWLDLPASYHNGATAFSFADGHAALHRWLKSTTVLPVQPNVPYLPIQIPSSPADAAADFDWMMEHMSKEN
jgi:prepilin-type N-terminal cleavage/methylation domain-containing protein/prepilin-type processing-associated H-X9-DG protein